MFKKISEYAKGLKSKTSSIVNFTGTSRESRAAAEINHLIEIRDASVSISNTLSSPGWKIIEDYILVTGDPDSVVKAVNKSRSYWNMKKAVHATGKVEAVREIFKFIEGVLEAGERAETRIIELRKQATEIRRKAG